MAMFTTKTIVSVHETDQKIRSANLSTTELHSLFEIERCVRWIMERNLKKVCLQFPDNLLCFSANVTSCLEAELGFKLYILGDGTYGSCCVDEIAAQHIGADAVIHFGHYCLSPTARLPVLYIFEKRQIDVTSFVSNMRERFSDPATKILLLYDVAFRHAIGAITQQLSESYPHLAVSKLLTDEVNQNENYSILGRTFKIEDELDKYQVVFIGPEGHCLETLIHEIPGCRFYIFDPAKHKSIEDYHHDRGRFHRRRMYLIEKVKHARTLGILIGTLTVANYSAAVDRVKTLAKNVGKKCYIIAVGKPNVAKLANFPEVEVFVLVACPESSLLDSKEFFQPIVTMHEVELALNSQYVWGEKHVTDFRTLLPGGCNYVAEKNSPDDYEVSHVSLIDGRLHSFQKSSPEPEENQHSTAISMKGDTTVSNPLVSHGLGLSSRSWTGLQQNLGETEVALCAPGLQGIPQKYTHEHYLDK
ncbi:2-(3-amino-3-carboxypropyl)histidine synthase subunit 2 [Anabrus simplex]|uniref:2-(3-amino-3-carboxypropyl)histidine synthase subunit 2 n=1 Tax=Anabrus simplex TaxID=316456 RepID=UPI0035A39093